MWRCRNNRKYHPFSTYNNISKKDKNHEHTGTELNEMPAFFILQGAPASGKSTFIHDNALDAFTVSSDEIRIELNGIGTDADGNPCIPQDNQQLVWRTVENRLRNAIDSRSPVVVLDAMNAVARNYRRFGDYAAANGYDVYLVDFTDVDVAECKRRNASREAFRRVPEFVIDNFYSRFNGYVPDGYVAISRDDASDIARALIE